MYFILNLFIIAINFLLISAQDYHAIELSTPVPNKRMFLYIFRIIKS